MLKGLALTPPVIGRIAIGRVVEKNGRRLPEKYDEFTITSQVQNKDGWVPHPVDEQLRQQEPGAKLRSIPVQLLFDDPDLSLRANYTMFDRATGRPLCVGDGERCMRATLSGMQSLPCPAPATCPLAHDGNCKPYARLHVRIDAGDAADDELGSFVFRTTGFNSIRTLSARLRYLRAVSGGILAGLPLQLRLRGKSTTLSHRTPIYYLDLTLRKGASLAAAVTAAREQRLQMEATGLVQEALDEAARSGLALGEFEESPEDGVDVLEEFYPELDSHGSGRKDAATSGVCAPGASGAAALRSKLVRKLQTGTGATGDPGGEHAGA